MKILAIHYPGCIPKEVLPSIFLLQKKYSIISAGPSFQVCEAYKEAGVTINLHFNEVSVEDIKAVLIPGGDPGSLIGNDDIDRLLISCAQKKAIMAAVCAGPLLLEKAGLLANKKISHGYDPEQIEWLKSQGHFLKTILSDDKLSIDGQFITAKPSEADNLAQKLLTKLRELHKIGLFSSF